MLVVKYIEWLGAFSGLAGSALLALNNANYSGYGFIVFLLSNLCWLFFGVKSKAWGLVSMQVGFTITSLLGVYNWLWAGKNIV